MELVRQKNVATYIVVPLVDADGDIVTGATSLDSEIDTWTDGAAPDGFTDCTNEATEVGSTGIYYLSLTQAEMNADYIYVQIKSSAKTQHVLINTMVGDPLNRAVTDDGTAINVASGIVEAQVKSIDANAITAASIATGAIDADAIADGAIDAGAIAADAITAAKVAADVSAEIADAVWDEDATGHQTGGTFGQAIGDPGADTNTIFKAVVTDATGVTVGADIVAIKAETASILTDTAEIGAAGAGLTAIDLPDQTMNITGNLSGSVGSVTGAVGSVTGNVGGNVTGSVGSLAVQAKADVNAEVVDGLATDTYAEPGQGTPAATASLSAKLGYLYKNWRNKKTQTATEWALYADDTTTKDQEAVVSDDATTATKGEISTGA